MNKKIKMACIYVILALQAVITIYPLIWMILSSLKDNVSFFGVFYGPYRKSRRFITM